MFTVAVLAREKSKPLADSFGFVKCQCNHSFAFSFEEQENCRRDNGVVYLSCPYCLLESNKVTVPRYTDSNGVEHGRMKYSLVYSKPKPHERILR